MNLCTEFVMAIEESWRTARYLLITSKIWVVRKRLVYSRSKNRIISCAAFPKPINKTETQEIDYYPEYFMDIYIYIYLYSDITLFHS